MTENSATCRRSPARAARVLFPAVLAGLLAALGAGCRPAAPDPAVQARRQARMVEEQLVRRGIEDRHVLAAMGKVPRHLFVEPRLAAQAYGDYPLPIGHGQTISQPYIVARMTELASVSASDRVLEIGTGSGYQAAVLAELVSEVFSIEIVPELARSAGARLASFGYRNVHVRTGDGYLGWPEAAPFDAIVVTAAPEEIPEPLQAQLADGGRLVIPIGRQAGHQTLEVITRRGSEFERRSVLDVAFVPLVREAAPDPSHAQGDAR